MKKTKHRPKILKYEKYLEYNVGQPLEKFRLIL